MATLHPKPTFLSDGILPNARPDTPPYTPHRTKRPLERADSPASSIQPTETSSPSKKAAKRRAVADNDNDNIKVEELVEGDSYFTDIEVIYPDELEEVETESDSFESYTDDGDEGAETSGLTRRLSRLRCGDDTEVDFEKERRERHLHRRTESRLFKRTHSESVKSNSEVVDAEAMADHDNKRGQRRLRRRVRGPNDSDQEASSSVYGANSSARSSVEPPSRPTTPLQFSDDENPADESMEVDET
ncbi:Hypothetical protein R9X50_00321200 [Acrodontium crateriforme]|uniref:Uncharacterized protein n=1 Tax=Acrodontium crateriforme TaxID=150365 RepID=A0AAQ3M2W1_9PEZI|nr:Hypothetical protein R9X50_00321200 [Acrodontium crateriforme]